MFQIYFLFFVFIVGVSSLQIDDTLVSSDSWQVLTRFCFDDSTKGDRGVQYSYLSLFLFRYTVEVPDDSHHILFLFPTDIDWKDITESPSTCAENYAKADFKFNLTSGSGFLPVELSKRKCFFVAIANCDPLCTGGLCQGNLNIDYSFSIQNGKTGGGRDGHLSCDEEGMLAVSAIFFCLQFLLVIAVFLIQMALTKIDKYHVTVKMLKWSVIITFVSFIFILIYYVYYNNDGHKWKLLHTFSAMFQQLSETILVLLLILLAKGWTIAVRKISRQGRMKIAIYFTVYLWVSLAAVLWKDYGLDELDSKFISKNPPGIVLIVVKCGVLLWFCYAMFTTCKNVHRKIHFYQKFFIASVTWIILCILFTGLVDVFQETKRITIYNSLMYVITYLLQLVFCILYYPNLKFNASFPFHMKTSDWSDKKDQEKRLVNPNPSDPEQMSDWFSAQTTYIRDLSLQLTKIFDSSFKEIYPATVQYLQGGRKRYNAEVDDDEINDNNHRQAAPADGRGSYEDLGSTNEELEDSGGRRARLNSP